MTAYESMTAKLRPTGLYTLAAGSAVDSELKAYAAELDRIYTALDVLLREAMITTAETYGITEREAYSGRTRPELSLAQRRALLLSREGLEGGHSADDLHALIASCGVTDYTATVAPRNNRITISVNTTLSTAQKADFEKQVTAFAPVTFSTEFYYT